METDRVEKRRPLHYKQHFKETSRVEWLKENLKIMYALQVQLYVRPHEEYPFLDLQVLKLKFVVYFENFLKYV